MTSAVTSVLLATSDTCIATSLTAFSGIDSSFMTSLRASQTIPPKSSVTAVSSAISSAIASLVSSVTSSDSLIY
jgi:hypothetical protein